MRSNHQPAGARKNPLSVLSWTQLGTSRNFVLRMTIQQCVNFRVGLLVASLVGFFIPCMAESAPRFDATWTSLERYQCPEWFRDAKLGIWSHWGPQSVPGLGDWYARRMYQQGGMDGGYEHHVRTYGHPSQFGYKDVIALWKAERFEPDRLAALFWSAGARYLVSMGVHHDNFDLWNSHHHRWNATQMGPKRDIVAAWKEAARKRGLRFGVSEHLAASFNWFQTAHGSDVSGPLAGVPYDGADPRWQDLYHSAVAKGGNEWYTTSETAAKIWSARITDLLDRYQPDLLWTDGGLPFGRHGRELMAHFYNTNIARHNGQLEAVYAIKDLRYKPGCGEYRDGIAVRNMDRGRLAEIQPVPWQTSSSIGDWFYNREYKTKETGAMYRSSRWVVHTLVDIVSKNGNLLLNVVQRPDGSLDPEVERLLAELAEWMQVNGEAIHATRPWAVFGEGPVRSTEDAPRTWVEDFAFSEKDLRFTQSKDGRFLYAIVLGWPTEGKLKIRCLAGKPGARWNRVDRVELLGRRGVLSFSQSPAGLEVDVSGAPSSTPAAVFRITGRELYPASP